MLKRWNFLKTGFYEGINHDWDGILLANQQARRAGIFSQLGQGESTPIYEVAGQIRTAFGL